MKKQYRFNKKQAGLTLIEAIVVLGILGAIIALVMYRQQMSTEQNRANDVVTAFAQTVADIRTAYSSSMNYTGLNNSLVINSGVIRSPLAGSGSSITDPWNNPINFYGASSIFGFVMKVPPADSSVCMKIVTTLSQNALQVVYNTSNITSLNATTGFSGTKIKDTLAESPVNYSVSAAATACASASNYLGFVYR